jgi:hypothetical protein
MNYLIYFTLLDEYSFTLSQCQFTGNNLTISPIFITDQSSVSYSGTPSSVNFRVENSNFISNIGKDNSGSFVIMNNKWIKALISGTTFNGNTGTQNLNFHLGDIYEVEFNNCTFLGLDTTSTSIPASVVNKAYSFNLKMTTVVITCAYTVSESDLITELRANNKTRATKPTLIVISSTGDNVFSGMSVSNCKGMDNGGVYRLTTGSLTDSSSQYDSCIAYQGTVYSVSESTVVTSSSITFTNSYAYQGAFIYSNEETITLTLNTATINNNEIFSRALFSGGISSTYTLTAVSMSSNTANEATIYFGMASSTFRLASSSMSSNTATSR